jgi:hypothetical protein
MDLHAVNLVATDVIYIGAKIETEELGSDGE